MGNQGNQGQSTVFWEKEHVLDAGEGISTPLEPTIDSFLNSFDHTA